MLLAHWQIWMVVLLFAGIVTICFMTFCKRRTHESDIIMRAAAEFMNEHPDHKNWVRGQSTKEMRTKERIRAFWQIAVSSLIGFVVTLAMCSLFSSIIVAPSWIPLLLGSLGLIALVAFYIYRVH